MAQVMESTERATYSLERGIDEDNAGLVIIRYPLGMENDPDELVAVHLPDDMKAAEVVDLPRTFAEYIDEQFVMHVDECGGWAVVDIEHDPFDDIPESVLSIHRAMGWDTI